MAAPKDKGEKTEKPEEEGGPPPARAVDLNHLVMPVATNDRLRNYLFVSVRLIVAGGVDVWDVRGQSHFMRDAIVRAAHKTDVAQEDNADSPDKDLVVELVAEAIKPIVGDETIEAIEVTRYDTSSRF